MRSVSVIFFILICLSSIADAFDFDVGDKQYELSAAYVLSNMNYEMTGDGFTSKTGNIAGNGMQIQVAWNRLEAQYQLLYFSSAIDEGTPTGLTPANTKTEFTRYLLQYTPGKSDSFSAGSENSWQWTYGLDFRTRESTNTIPNQFISAHRTLGGWVGLKHSRKVLSDKLNLKSGAGLLIPLIHQESGQQTGNLKWNLSPDVHATLGMNISPGWTVSAGVQMLMELKSYSGLAERGVGNAKETFYLVNVPLEIKYEF